MNTEQLINLLCLPESYPHPVEVITTIETHISVVFLTGQYAYKLKKPVDFGFLNFTKIPDRHFFCNQELRLNRRTAPNLYLDVVPVYIDSNEQIRVSSSTQKHLATSEPIDYLVKMNQFEPNSVLGRYLVDHQLSNLQESQLAQQIAELHLTSNQVDSDSHLGEPKTILQPMLDNFPILLERCNENYKPLLEKLLAWTHQQFETLTPYLIARKQNGFVRECHGDLHLDNITLIDGVPTLFDGIEFNDEFRWIDGISDLAFLLIDLDFREQAGLKRRLFSQYMNITGDHDAMALLSFYRVYRSLVRAKISALRFSQLDNKSADYQHYRQITLQYILQAKSDAFNTQPPQLILLQGVSGSGKSYLSKQLLEQIEAVVISSDIERKRLFGVKATHRVTECEKTALYSAEMSQKTYDRLQALSSQILTLGTSVIVDATFLKQTHRLPFFELAKRLGVDCKVLYIETDEATAKYAIESRLALNNDPSDADVTVMLNQLKVIEAPTDQETSLTLKANELRHFFPSELTQEFLF